MKSKNKYSLPLKKKDIKEIPNYSPAHVGKLKHSVDFTCKKGTKLFSAQDGKVVWIKNDSKIGGPNKKYWNDGNRIVIGHKNKEYSAYEHLKYKGNTVKVGDKINKGQLIGYSGNTGYTFGPHLHFEVFRFTGPDKEKDFETLEVNWEKK
ncbi:MAG: M23 family metallopeptidase [Candidatus Pacearchaeota archaeon]|jgi:murein DD-endopeptidase MepM/ murein hydrolase activator NlpD